ncbi:threonylcarbamoyladenosine tRNA methylthiotransferase [Atheta coriaria]|uniref:threonylcarbamoyladenosine tRNA methylthiotransferase n=1 Tax=Dalotia coriaria TaxID=877792 RepID=UPI0031F3CD83
MACNEIIDDIEDLISAQDITPKERYSNRKNVRIKAKKRTDKDDFPKPVTSNMPGTQTIYVKTWGCAHNNSDSEYMAGQLAAYGYTLTENKNEADLWLLNSCTVKNPAEDHFRNEIESGQQQGKHIVLAGCVPQGAPKSSFMAGLSVIGVQQIDRVVEVVEETLKGNTCRILGMKKSNGKKSGGASLQLPKVRRNPLIEIIAINTGCLNQCTYCKTKHARGDLGSYPPEEIIARAVQAFEEGVVEIWLTSEDTGTYGRDIGSSLPELLWKLVEVIPEGCRLRLGMTNPPYILDYLDEMAKIMAHPRVYSFLHVPVQSGSDSVLGDMKREYCRADFERVVNTLQSQIAGMTIATDIICGFPTETLDDFEETLTLCEKYKFPSLFINQFFPRPGTPAALMPRIPAQDVKLRTRRLTDLFNSYEPYGHKIGEIQEVLVTETSHDKKHYVGHNKFYEQVLVPIDEAYMGKLVTVKITSATKFSMMGEPINEKSVKMPGIKEPLQKGKVSGVVEELDQKRDERTERHLKYALMAVAVSLLLRFLWFLM